MNERISALVDGELEVQEAAATIDVLKEQPEALLAWRHYHLISDAMRDTSVLSAGFAERVAARLAGEPTVLAPRRLAASRASSLRIPAAIAAGLAGIGLVGYLAFAPQQQGGLLQQTAQSPATVTAKSSPIVAKPALIPLPSATPDYLLAHQGFSPRVSLQGMAPYARTVSSQASGARR